jgi:hypothetical protein
MRLMSIALLLAFASGVTGCVLPPAFTIASLMADGVSLASSGKTVTDHAISLLAHEDCRLWRLFEGKSVCGSQATVVTVARLPALPLRAASPATRPPEPIDLASAPVETPVSEVAVAAATAVAEPAPTPSPAQAVAPVVARQPSPAMLNTAPRQIAPTAQAGAPAAPSPRRTLADAPARGEMVIRSGTDEAEARALANDLHAVGASVRPVRRGEVTIYEVVMGLSG